MADGSNIIALVPTSRERAAEAEVIQLRPGHPQSPAGVHGFAAPDSLPADVDGNRVLINGVRARTFMSESNAIRSAHLLNQLADLGWPIERLIERGPSNPEAA